MAFRAQLGPQLGVVCTKCSTVRFVMLFSMPEIIFTAGQEYAGVFISERCWMNLIMTYHDRTRRDGKQPFMMVYF
jgi:hypothetical protein